MPDRKQISPFGSTLRRELARMKSRPMYFILTVGIMSFCIIFFISLFNEGQLLKMPIGIVDHDNSKISRQFVRNLNATQQAKIAMKLGSYQEARTEMQKGNIYAFVEIKSGFAENLQANRRPPLTFYINDAYLTAGSLLLKDITAMSLLTSGGVQQQILSAKGIDESLISGIIQPIAVDTHMIGNPWSNYSYYFLNVFFPGVLEFVILMTTVFVIGIELKEKTSRKWLRTADNNFIIALFGKLLPYTAMFIVWGFVCNIILYGFLYFPVQASIFRMLLATVLYVIACQCVGILIIGILPVLRDSVSIVMIFGMFGFTFTGFTFPIEQMNYPVRIFSEMYPIRHFFNIYTDQVVHGVDFRYSVVYYFILLAYTLLPFLIFFRLKKAAIYQNYPIK
ncbi:MAG: type transporter [Bacteroidetes bacterium]|nr:type transporter [Bacteroidota bacterium]